nr:RES family NAD+ phosphorylase [Pseudomonas sp. efr-133-TYG-103a]
MHGEFAQLGDLAEKLVCQDCIGEKYLSSRIEADARMGCCSYCADLEIPCVTVAELADRVQAAVGQHYTRTSDGPDDYQNALLRDRESDYDWSREGEPILDVVTYMLGVEEEIASDVLELLDERFDCRAPGDPDEGETEFSATSFYEEKPLSHNDWDQKWQRLEVVLKSEARFFNQEVLDILKSVFNNLHQVRSRTFHVALAQIGPGTELESLYRAREFQSLSALQKALEHPVAELGPPPGPLARAGRMNPSGISVFYGAEQAHAAISEVRPVVGSDVIVAKFSITRPLQLLDLRALEVIGLTGSVFDPDFAEEKQRMGFLETLTERLTVPVMPGEQDREYLTTQAVADYLAGMPEPHLDGILFPSVQDGKGVNVVLFHKAALVEPLDTAGKKVVSASTRGVDYETGDSYPEYEITTDSVSELDDLVPMHMHRFSSIDAHQISTLPVRHREHALRLELESIEVHRVEAVVVQTTSLPVSVLPKSHWKRLTPPS